MMLDTIYIGDCREILPTFPSESVHLVITSPPYGTLKTYSHLEADLGNLDLNEQVNEYTRIFAEIHRILCPGRYFCLFFMDIHVEDDDGESVLWSPQLYLVPPILSLGFKLKGIFIWDKVHFYSKGNPGRPYPPLQYLPASFEYIFVFKKRGKADYSHLTEEQKRRSEIPQALFHRHRGIFSIPNDYEAKKIHPAPFPVELIKYLVMAFSYVGEVVLDPFMGIGTTAVAAAQLERHFVGIELNPSFVEVALKRLEAVRSQVELFQSIIKERKAARKGSTEKLF